jgi:hypothetical protein
MSKTIVLDINVHAFPSSIVAAAEQYPGSELARIVENWGQTGREWGKLSAQLREWEREGARLRGLLARARPGDNMQELAAAQAALPVLERSIAELRSDAQHVRATYEVAEEALHTARIEINEALRLARLVGLTDRPVQTETGEIRYPLRTLEKYLR